MSRLTHLRPLIAVLSVGMATPVASAADPFIAKYLAAEKKLLDRYAHNRKVVSRSKHYLLDKDYNPVLVSLFEFTMIYGENAFRSKGRQDYRDKDDQWVTGYLTGALRIPSAGYSLTPGDTPNSYRIKRQYVPRSDVGSRPPMPFLYSLMYGGDDAMLPLGDVFRHLGQKVPGTPTRQTLLSISPTTWQDKPAIAVKIRSTLGNIVSTTYVDPTNDYAALGYETDVALDVRIGVKVSKGSSVRRMGVLTYAPSAEGIPLPAKYEFWYILPDGRKQPQGVDEFLEYSRYTPTADDFDLEKQFGVKPLPPETKETSQPRTDVEPLPPSEAEETAAIAERGRCWLYAALATIALATIGMILYRRRQFAKA